MSKAPRYMEGVAAPTSQVSTPNSANVMRHYKDRIKGMQNYMEKNSPPEVQAEGQWPPVYSKNAVKTKGGFLRRMINGIHYMSKERYMDTLPAGKRPLFIWVVVLIQLVLMGWILVRFGFENVKINPLLGPPFTAFIEFGAAIPSLVKKKFAEESWRMIAACFLHGGLLHFVANVSCELTLGADLENHWGLGAIAFVFFTAAVFGSMCTVIVRTHDVIAVGASGGILGYI